MKLSAEIERFPLANRFTISRGSKTEAAVVRVTLSRDGVTGHGECVPYGRYGETVEGTLAEIEALRDEIAAGLDRMQLQDRLPPGAARNALDCAFWDLEAKLAGTPVSALAGVDVPSEVITAYTISLDTPEGMAAAARRASACPLLKLKLGGAGDGERVAAVREAVPNARLIVDANEGWTAENLEANLAACGAAGVELVEQPLSAADDAALARIARTVPVCADESAHGLNDFDRLVGRYDAINIKLDKTGGLTEALALAEAARHRGLGVMVGCMVSTSLSMAPALLLAGKAKWVDLDGPLLLAEDRAGGLVYENGRIIADGSALWGGRLIPA